MNGLVLLQPTWCARFVFLAALALLAAGREPGRAENAAGRARESSRPPFGASGAPEIGPGADRALDGAREGCRVLIVDDSKPMADTFVTWLKLRGHDARAVYEGEEALQILGEYRPEVVFSDIAMPGMSGHELAASIRGNPELSAAVLVALSGYGRAEDKRQAIEAGFDFHFTKPVDFRGLEPVFQAARTRRAGS